MTGFHTDDVQTLERITTNQNDHSETTESVTMTNSPKTIATTTPTMATNDHRHEWGREAAAAFVVLFLPTTFVLQTIMMMMTAMRTGL